MLCVAVAALISGLIGGLVASGASFLGLNFFFTPPFRTFAVDKIEDLIALIAFLVVSALIAALLGQAIRQRALAQRREEETWLLYNLSSRLLRGDRFDLVLESLATDLASLFDLAWCRVFTTGPGEITATAGSPGGEEREMVFELRTDRGHFGEIQLAPRPGRSLSERERDVAEGLAGQIALAVETSRLAEETRQANAEAEVSRIRAALFSSVTHDLRTPLASIKASATSLLEEGVEFDRTQQSELLSTIAEESDRLNRLIGNLLELSRLRAGALTPQRRQVSIDEVIDDVTSRLRRILGPYSLSIRIREGTPSIDVDPIQLDQALSNLLENAATFSPEGLEITIDVAPWEETVEIRIADRGPGIPENEREEVFEEFYHRGSHGGTGLGLAIARAVVVAHGGKIRVAETPGGGTTMIVSLPRGDSL